MQQITAGSSRRRSTAKRGSGIAIPVDRSGRISAFTRVLLLGLAALVAVAAVTLTPPASAQQRRKAAGHAERKAPLKDAMAAGAKVALGVNLADGPSVPELNAFATMIGLKPRLVMWYEDWKQPLIVRSQLRRLRRAGALPLITWDPQVGGSGVSLRAIAEGHYDRYIDSTARAANRWRRPVYVRFAHEMNAGSSPFGPGHRGDLPRTFRAAWRHIVRVFRDRGAGNVRWVWSPNVECAGVCPFTAYYPGNNWVDWVALDGYNYGPVTKRPWRSFADVFGQSYSDLTRLATKPVMIAETASTERGGSKAAWILSMAAALRTQFRKVRALVWFDRLKETDWRVDSSPASLTAFRTVVASGLFYH